MHSKRLGNLGELKVASYLAGLGFSVFAELGDISKKDLILEYNNRLLGIQVKAISKVNGAYPFASKKSGPNYQFKYTAEDCDIFAIYCIEDDVIAWLTSEEATRDKRSFTFRVDTPKNQQVSGVAWLKDYVNLSRILEGQ